MISGSVSIISEAIHSGIDLVAAVMAFFSVKISSKPPDDEHPYGHGKFENISGLFEVILIIVAGVFIIYESVKKLLEGSTFRMVELGFAVMLFSAIVNFFISRRLYKVARDTDSVALEADALHLRTDVFTSLGVAAGLGIIWLTGLKWLDPIIAITVALYILWEASKMLRKAFAPLVDTQLPNEDVKKIITILDAFVSEEVSYHRLRTRKSGPQNYIDLHLDLPNSMSVVKAHEICDQIECAIKQKFPRVDINIHIEPRERKSRKTP